MKESHLLQFLLIFMILGCKRQNELILNVKTVNINPVKELRNQSENLGKIYDDKDFEVWRSCSGEWGGMIYFQDKKTDRIYGAKSTCPVSVDKMNNIYYVSNNLNHMIGFSNVIEIKNPKEMMELKAIPKFEYNSGVITKEFEYKSNQGTQKLVDSSGVLILTSFIYKNELYSVISSNIDQKTTISKIQNGKFVTMLDLTKKIVLKSNTLVEKNNSEKQKILFSNPQKSGIIEISKNIIDLTLYEK